MKSLKNVLAALAFVFAIGAAFATSANADEMTQVRFTDLNNFCQLTSDPCTAGPFSCQILGVSYFQNTFGSCGTQLTNTAPPN